MQVRETDEFLVEAGDVGDQLLAMRGDLCSEPDPFTRARHLAAMDAAASRPVADAGHGRRRRPRALVLAGAATLSVLALTSGLAAAGTLPKPVQRQAARMAHAVGWDIPGPVDPVPDLPRGGSNPGSPGSDRNADDSSGPPTTAVGSNARADGAPTPIPSVPAPAPSAPDAPGSSGDAPGQTGSGSDAPGSSGNAPGHTGSTPSAPGSSGNAPGHTGADVDATGKSGSAPGHATSRGAPESTPERSGNAPGHSGR